jgi:hypothetical protein
MDEFVDEFVDESMSVQGVAVTNNSTQPGCEWFAILYIYESTGVRLYKNKQRVFVTYLRAVYIFHTHTAPCLEPL